MGQKEWARAREFIGYTGLVPSPNNNTDMEDQVETVGKLDECIKKNFHAVALATMTCLTNLHQSVDGGRQALVQRRAELRAQATDLVTLVGRLKYQMPRETLSRLTQMEVLMS